MIYIVVLFFIIALLIVVVVYSGDFVIILFQISYGLFSKFKCLLKWICQQWAQTATYTSIWLKKCNNTPVITFRSHTFHIRLTLQTALAHHQILLIVVVLVSDSFFDNMLIHLTACDRILDNVLIHSTALHKFWQCVNFRFYSREWETINLIGLDI